MKLTTKSEYSLLALIHLARHEKDGFVKVEDICDKYSLSKKYLEALFSTIKKKKLIETKRSAAGGYRLAKPSNRISIAEIIRSMDGPLAPTRSASRYFHRSSPIEKEKKALKVMREIREYVANKLERLTLADLI